MDPMIDWIAPLIRRLVSSYLREDSDVVSCTEDNGSNLRFTNCPCRGALITQWKDRSEKHPTFVDSQTQIDAILTQASINEYQNETSENLPCIVGTTGCLIQLLEFEVVFEYSGGQPEIHLFVKHFKIDRSRRSTKSAQGRKSIKKNRNVCSLMWDLFRKISESTLVQGSVAVAGSNQFEDSDDSEDFDGSVNSQNEGSGIGATQEALLSQLPFNRHPMPPREVPNGNRESSTTTHGTELLLHLQTHKAVPTSDLPSGYVNQPNSHPKAPPLETERMSIDSQHANNRANEEDASIAPPGDSNVRNTYKEGSDAVEPPVSYAGDNNAAEVPKNSYPIGPTRQSSPKAVVGDQDHSGRHIEGREQPKDNLEGIGREDETTRITSLSRPSNEQPLCQEPNVQLAGSQSVKINRTRIERAKVSNGLNNSHSNPWKGMTRIRKRDVKIPRDQRKLLEDSRRWMPPDIGMNAPEAHVPPSLLKLWNSIAFQRSRVDGHEEKSSESESSENSEPSHHSDSASQLNSNVDDDDESAEEPFSSWSASDNEFHDAPAQVPPDSSPIRRGTSAQKAAFSDERVEDSREGQLPGTTNSSSIGESNCAVTEQSSRGHGMVLEATSMGSDGNREFEAQNIVLEPVASSQAPREPNDDSNVSEEPRHCQEPGKQSTPPGNCTKAAPQSAGDEHHPPVTNTADGVARESEPAEQNTVSEPVIEVQPVTGVQPAADSEHANDPNTRNEVTREAEDNQNPTEQLTVSEPVPTASGEVAENESDAESVMDTSVPCALGNSSQMVSEAGREEQEITSSGTSHPRLHTEEQVQVLVTPATELNRLRSNRLQERDDNWGVGAFQPESSQVEKSSSQSRVFNTYGSNDGHEQGDPSQKTAETTNSSVAHQERESHGFQVIGTQESSGDSSLGDTMFHSQPDSVLNSPAPINHEQITRTLSPAIQRSGNSHGPSPSHDQPSPQVIDESHLRGPTERLPVAHSPKDTPMPSLKRPRRSSNDGTKEPLPKRSRFHSNERNYETGEDSRTPIPNITSHQQSHVGTSGKHAEARKVYDKFQKDYLDYAGDFSHFIEQCAKLQALRDKGELRRSFLWDDFIIMHLREYPQYEEQCLSTDTKRMDYEDFFKSNFSRPLHKKRSLTAIGIEISAAAQNDPVSRPSISASPSVPRRLIGRSETNHSFTGSLADRLTNLHTFSPTTRRSSSIGSAADRRSNPVLTPSPHKKKKINHDTPTHKPDVIAILAELPNRDTTPQPSRPAPNPPDKNGTAAANNDRQNTVDNQETIDPHGNRNDEMDETHETASIELGDVPHPSNNTEHHEEHLEAEAEVEAEAEAEPESSKSAPQYPRKETGDNWFASMAYFQPSGPDPVWSDSPNTPFKKWAQAEQNTIVESRRRGRFAIPLNEKGVIKVPSSTYFLRKE